jgi:3-oxoacyl-[acyl-carrier protein] reductase
MDFGLQDKKVLVTAASKGIGRATAESFLKEGAKVAICSSSKDNLVNTVEEIKSSIGYEPLWIVCDINKMEDIERTINVFDENFGSVDILVNNCGGPKPGYFEDLVDADWEDGFNQVLMSAVRFTRLVLPSMEARKWGRIINVTSLSVKQPVDNLLLSNAFRSALTSFAKTLSNQIGQYNITVNNVAPGYTLTSRLYELALKRAKESGESHEDVLVSMANNVPLKRLGKPEEIADFIVYLASDNAGYINGTTTQIDGGIIKSTY